MVEGEHEYGLVDEDGWKVVRTPKSFEEALVHLHETLKEKTPNKTNDVNTKFLRGIRIEHAHEMLQLAIEAYNRKEISHAWYFLTEVAECVGFLVGSEGAIYPRKTTLTCDPRSVKQAAKAEKLKARTHRRCSSPSHKKFLPSKHRKAAGQGT